MVALSLQTLATANLPNAMPQQPILILGAGIGGLTLGRCLRKEGISFVIYEKATSSPRHNLRNHAS